MHFWNQFTPLLQRRGLPQPVIRRLRTDHARLGAPAFSQLDPQVVARSLAGLPEVERLPLARNLLQWAAELARTHPIEPGPHPDPRGASVDRDDTLLPRLAGLAADLGEIGVADLRDLKVVLRSTPAKLDALDLADHERRQLDSIASLTTLFSPDIAVALLDAGLRSPADVAEADPEAITAALVDAGISDMRSRLELARVATLKDLLNSGRDSASVGGLDLDGIDFLTAEQQRLLGTGGIDTLSDWAAAGRELDLPEATAIRLDGHCRLMALGVGGKTAAALIENKLASALDLARIDPAHHDRIAGQTGIKPDELGALSLQAQMRTGHLVGMVDGSIVAGPDGTPGWIKDLIEAGYKGNACIECQPDNSALSRFAYLVYLIQRSGLTLDELNILLGNGIDLRTISPDDGSATLPDPEASCATISRLDLIIRRMQELLDQLQIDRPQAHVTRDYSHLDFNQWRAERLASFHPELQALWRHDILTGADDPPPHGSILANPADTRPQLLERMQLVRTTLANSRLALNRTGSPDSLTPGQFNSLPTLAAGSPPVHASIHAGVGLIEQILAADADIEQAVQSLADEQPGLALISLGDALGRLTAVARDVFESTSPWIQTNGDDGDDGSGGALETRLLQVTPATRAHVLQQLFNELISGAKRLFRPSRANQNIIGLSNNGALDISVGWHNTGTFSGDGFRVSTNGGNGSKHLRYNSAADDDFGPFTNCRLACDFVLDEDLPPNRWLGVGVRLSTNFGNGQRTNSGLLARVRRTQSGTGSAVRVADVLELQSLAVDINGAPEVKTVATADIGAYHSGEGALNSIDSDNHPLRIGRRYRLELRVTGNEAQALIRVSATKTVTVVRSGGDIAVNAGTFGFMTSAAVDASFDQIQLEIEGGAADTPPFHTSHRPAEARHLLDHSLYTDHSLDGTGMQIDDLLQLPLLSPVALPTPVRLSGLTLPAAASGGERHFLVFAPGGMRVDLAALDRLLDRLLGATFYQRFAVIPTLAAEALRQRGDYSAAVARLHLLYDDGPADEFRRHMYPEFAFPADSFNRKLSPDARLLRLRLGHILLEQADLSFRQDTADSRHAARRLYRRVLRLHDNASCKCEGIIGQVTEAVMDRVVKLIVEVPDIGLLDDPARFADLIGRLHDLEPLIKVDGLLDLIRTPANSGATDPAAEFKAWLDRVHDHLDQLERGHQAHIREQANIRSLTRRGDQLMREADLRAVAMDASRPLSGFARAQDRGRATSAPNRATQRRRRSGIGSGYRFSSGFGQGGGPGSAVPPDSQTHWSLVTVTYPPFCVAIDPVRVEQVRTACLHLDLLADCRNILGYPDSFVPIMKFDALLKHARFFADQAAASERDLSQTRQALEQHLLSLRDAEKTLKLRGEERLIESLGVDVARGEVRTAQIQHARASHSVNHHQNLLSAGLSDMERLSLQAAWAAALFSGIAAGFSLVAAAPALMKSGVAVVGLLKMSTGVLAKPGAIATAAGLAGTALGGGQALGSAASSIASAANATSNAAGKQATFERRAQQWQFQMEQDTFHRTMLAQQVQQSLTRLEIARRREDIARLKQEFAADTLRFLGHRFFNRDMWRWLQATLRDQYRTRLHFAIATGFMAERALAFETQQREQRFVRFDYFQPSRDGLLGARQLQTDLSHMEFTRLAADNRKLKLTRVLSISEHFPIEFEQFKAGSGVLPFSTAGGTMDAGDDGRTQSLELFDRDYPGHHLRLIHSVRVTVVALVPPHDGIRASLGNSGVSRVVIADPDNIQAQVLANAPGADHHVNFKEITVTRPPETIALTSPFDAGGVFQLEQDRDHEGRLLPFEGLGVATDWVFKMPKACNAIDYRTIADILVTLEYTALDSEVYRRQVQQRLDPVTGQVRGFSLRQQFPEAWDELHAPDQSTTPLQLSFPVIRGDFPPHLTDLKIRHVSLLILGTDAALADIDAAELKFTAQGAGGGAIGGSATLDAGLTGSRHPGGAAWTALTDREPIGNWTLTLADTADVRSALRDNLLEDILIAFTVTGRLPDWP